MTKGCSVVYPVGVEENEEELARLYFFVLERKKKEKEEMDRLKNQNQPSQGTRYVSGD